MLHLILSLNAFAETTIPPQSFAHLKKIDIAGEASIYVPSSVDCQPIEQEIEEEDGFDYDGPPVYDVCILEIANEKNVKIVYSSGPSDDPFFQFYPISKKRKTQEKTPIFELGATTLYIPNKNNIYAEGWSNTMFNLRRKYSFDGKVFQEVQQPFLYVGIQTKVQDVNGEKNQKGLTLYTDKTKINKVAILPIGSDIEVLLHEKPDWYLVRSSFGLVGWVYVPLGLYDTKIGVRFAGD